MSVDANGAIHSGATGQFTGRVQREADADEVLPAQVELAAPNGCAVCGRDLRDHGNIYTRPHGAHTWVRPDQQLVKQRILARRTAQQATGIPDPVLVASCGPACWTPATCPVHGDTMNPRGRSAGLDSYDCCDNRYDPKVNPRHLWSEHDEVRSITDPVGWQDHLDECASCRGEAENED